VNAKEKKAGGFYTLDLAAACTLMRVHIADIQRDLIRLKAIGEISIKWEDMSYLITLHRQPSNFDQLVDDMTDTLKLLEEAQLRKVNIVAQSMRIVSIPTWNHNNNNQSATSSSLSSSSSSSNDTKDMATTSGADIDNRLSDIIGQYFGTDDDAALLRELDQKAKAVADARQAALDDHHSDGKDDKKLTRKPTIVDRYVTHIACTSRLLF
jgi:hypothetical protein